MTSSTSNRELIYALADSQLHGDALEEALGFFTTDDTAMASWAHVHMMGDVLRAPAADAGLAYTTASSFLDRFNQALAASATPAVPVISPAPSSLPRVGAVGAETSAANDRFFGWKLAGGFAALAVVSVMAWTSLANQQLAPAAQMAQQSTPAQVLVASPQGIIVRDARLNELLAAHKQLGAGSALQAPSGFLQSAAFETTSANER